MWENLWYGSAVKAFNTLATEPGFILQYSNSSSQLPVTQIPGNLMPAFKLYMRPCTHECVKKELIHTNVHMYHIYVSSLEYIMHASKYLSIIQLTFEIL